LIGASRTVNFQAKFSALAVKIQRIPLHALLTAILTSAFLAVPQAIMACLRSLIVKGRLPACPALCELIKIERLYAGEASVTAAAFAARLPARDARCSIQVVAARTFETEGGFRVHKASAEIDSTSAA